MGLQLSNKLIKPFHRNLGLNLVHSYHMSHMLGHSVRGGIPSRRHAGILHSGSLLLHLLASHPPVTLVMPAYCQMNILEMFLAGFTKALRFGAWSTMKDEGGCNTAKLVIV